MYVQLYFLLNGGARFGWDLSEDAEGSGLWAGLADTLQCCLEVGNSAWGVAYRGCWFWCSLKGVPEGVLQLSKVFFFFFHGARKEALTDHYPCRVGVMGVAECVLWTCRKSFEGYCKSMGYQGNCPYSWDKVKHVSNVCLPPPGLPLVIYSVCDFHGQDLKTQPEGGGSLVWGF